MQRPGENRKFNRKRFKKPQSEFDNKLLDLTRVTRVTAGGKQLRFRAVIVVGNKKGKVGVGVSKGADVQKAIEKATRLAKKNIIQVPVSGHTIPYEVEAKCGPAKVLLRPQREGRGLVAGGVVRVICQLSGVPNISSKLLSRSRNKLNIARATIQALKQLQLEEVKETEEVKEAEKKENKPVDKKEGARLLPDEESEKSEEKTEKLKSDKPEAKPVKEDKKEVKEKDAIKQPKTKKE